MLSHTILRRPCGRLIAVLGLALVRPIAAAASPTAEQHEADRRAPVGRAAAGEGDRLQAAGHLRQRGRRAGPGRRCCPTSSFPPGPAIALEAIPGPAADEALREAMGKAPRPAAGGRDQFDRRAPRRQGGRACSPAAERRRRRGGLRRGRGPGPHRRHRGRQGPGTRRLPPRRPRSARRWPKAASCARNASWPRAMRPRP